MVDFPEPDCPAMAKIFPCSTEKFTEFTAIISSESDEKKVFFLKFLC